MDGRAHESLEWAQERKYLLDQKSGQQNLTQLVSNVKTRTQIRPASCVGLFLVREFWPSNKLDMIDPPNSTQAT